MTGAAIGLLAGKAVIREEILAGVMKRHLLGKESFFGRGRRPEYCAARRDAAILLRGAGFSKKRIAQILQRDRSTITYYLSAEMSARKRSRRRIYQLLESLEPDVRDLVGQLADADDVSPMVMVREWINERARFEGEARGRNAA